MVSPRPSDSGSEARNAAAAEAAGLRISAIVPVLDEGLELRRFLRSLDGEPPDELIVVDGGSRDATAEVARRVRVLDRQEFIRVGGGLAAQLNAGAAAAQGEILFFPYVDTRLPVGWREAVESVCAGGGVGGGFRLGLDSPLFWYRPIEFAANWRSRLGLGPLGDQAIFVRRSAFEALGGFREDVLLEDLDFVRRLRRSGRVVILPKRVSSSVRRWRHNGLLPTTAHNWRFLFWHLLGERSRGRRADYRAYRVRCHREGRSSRRRGSRSRPE